MKKWEIQASVFIKDEIIFTIIYGNSYYRRLYPLNSTNFSNYISINIFCKESLDIYIYDIR